MLIYSLLRGNSHRLCIWNWHFYRNSRILLALDGSTCRFRAFQKRPLLNTFRTVIPCLYWLLQRCIWQYSPLWWCPKEWDLTFVAVIEVFSFPLVSWRRLPVRPSEPYCQGLHLSSRLYQRLYSLMYPMYPLQLQLLLVPPNLQWKCIKVGTCIYFETDIITKFHEVWQQFSRIVWNAAIGFSVENFQVRLTFQFILTFLLS